MNAIPLVVHVIYRLDFGGLETLLAECVNCIDAEKYRHAVVCLTDYTTFSKKITRPGVGIFALNKLPGLGLGTHVRLWRLLRRLRPAILHTYNLSAIEYAFTAALAGVPIRIHAEHGRGISDLDGTNRKHNLLRRLLIPCIDCYIPVSADLRQWLKATIGVPDQKNLLINNGVDTDLYRAQGSTETVCSPHVATADGFVIGCVGRIQDVKNHAGLIDAFIQLRAMLPSGKMPLRLTIVGDGPLLPALREKIRLAGIADLVWLPGSRTDIAHIMRTFSVFALPSMAEGTPVTVLEAMATGLPVVASRVGGLPDIVIDNVTGKLVPAADTDALANALAHYYRNPGLMAQHGSAGRALVAQKNSLASMLAGYTALYDTLCATKKINARPVA
ncbi:MAG: TIGR03088 family PEP-CTERM/XrtA system glycosyltransferase [Massilia sp.]|nr:TIGR03088 family PEP-CTERM/XrtA system glycosyltransferase [Massilia sp.]